MPYYLCGDYRSSETLLKNSANFHEPQKNMPPFGENPTENPLRQIKSEYSGPCQSLPPMSSLTQRMLETCSNRAHEQASSNTGVENSGNYEQGYGIIPDSGPGHPNDQPTYSSWNEPDFENVPGSRQEHEIGNSRAWHRANREVDQENVKLKCTICTRSFTSFEQYTVHMDKHENSTKYHCPKCNQSYFCMGSLRRHMQVCCSGNTLTCPICNKQFQYPETLKDHLRGKHLIGDMYKCVCGKEFRWRETFSKHKKQCPVKNMR